MKQFKDTQGGGPLTLVQEDALQKERGRANAKSLAAANLPTDKDVSAEGYLKSIRAGYENILSREIKKVPANADLVADLELKASEEKSSVYQDKLTQANKKLHAAMLELNEMDGDDGTHISKVFIWIGIVVIAFCEAFLTYKSVGGLLDVGNNAVLLIILLGFTVLYICIPKALSWYYEEYVQDKQYRAFLYLIPIVILGAGYFCLGYLRSHFMQMQAALDVNGDGSNAPAFIASPWVFCALNALFLLASYYLNRMLPTRQQSRNKMELRKKERSILKLESDIEKYEGLLGQMPDHGKNNLIRASHSNEARKDIYNQINSMFLQTCGIFIDTNLQYRTDGIRPKCFDVAVEDLKDIYNNQ